MTILNPSPIIEKLEEDGVEIVKAKKAKGFYRDEKLPLINRWLAEKAQKIKDSGKSTITLTGDPNEVMEGSQDPEMTEPEMTEPDDAGLDEETLALAKSSDEEYKAADSATKRKITMARKKVVAEKKDEASTT